MAPLRSIKIAILAMGGEGGGVLADWIAELAVANGYLAQATSVPGVAQRTGATIYYLELFPKSTAGKRPVLALMPVPGDVDIVIASELMEAGRAVQRGFVTPDRTTLVASTHRVYAIGERTALADGRVDEKALREGIALAANRLVAFDMMAIAEANVSIISAVLFGALAGAGVLPFSPHAYETTIRKGGTAVKTSLAAFAAGLQAAQSNAMDGKAPPQPMASRCDPALESLLAEVGGGFAGPALAIIRHGVLRTAEYQDIDYARRYLALLVPIRDIGRSDRGSALLCETARQLALAMTYEDIVRVAELKIHPARFARIREETKLADGQLLEVADFLHPRVQEIADSLPEKLGRWLLRTDWARGIVERLTESGRVVKPTSVRGFLLLYLAAIMRPSRLRSLRFAREQREIADWLGVVSATAKKNYPLAVEVAAAHALVKGYGETHERGRSKFERLLAGLPRLAERADAVALAKTLRQASLADETGTALVDALGKLDLIEEPPARAAE